MTDATVKCASSALSGLPLFWDNKELATIEFNSQGANS